MLPTYTVWKCTFKKGALQHGESTDLKCWVISKRDGFLHAVKIRFLHMYSVLLNLPGIFKLDC